MSRYPLLILVLFATKLSFGQVPKQSVLEHFTNSNCGVCAYYNPFIFDTLANYPHTLRIAFYPSSPYAACFFSMQNVADNDARTYFYNVFGSTPKLLLNGALTPFALLDSSLSAQQHDSSNFALSLTQFFLTPDSVQVQLAIKKVAADTLSSARLFVAAFEDSVQQSTANGETLHQDVFRHAMTTMQGDSINLPVNVNDSVTVQFNFTVKNNWQSNQMQSIAILQRTSDKQVVQAGPSHNVVSMPLALTTPNRLDTPLFYPNPAKNKLFVSNAQFLREIALFDLQGNCLKRESKPGDEICLPALSQGVYLLQINTSDTRYFTKLVINP